MSNSDRDNPRDATDPDLTRAANLQTDQVTPITLGTLIMFLLGDRIAILSLAAHRATLWLGMILVFSAAFAREYDGEDLLYEPWHLLLPLFASLATSFILFGLVSLIAWRRHAGLRGFWSRYRTFLSLYWMTAPLAWVYAIPVERFLSAGKATTANLTFLAAVSLWRVLLITRILSLLLSTAFSQIFFIVMLFADVVALTLISQVDIQVFAIMGGVRLTEAEAALASAMFLVMFFGTLTWPIWSIVSLALTSRRLTPWKWSFPLATTARAVSKSVWVFSTLAVVVWFVPLPWTQAEQQLRGTVERAFRAERYSEMLAAMSAHQREDFPPHWDPPPRISASGERPRILKLISALSNDTAPWVRTLYCQKLSDAIGRSRFPDRTLWNETNAEDLLKVIDELPESVEIVKGKTILLSNLPRLLGSEISENSPTMSRLRLKSITPPDENSDPAIDDWQWDTYLYQLNAEKDQQLVLKYHGLHLKRILENSKVVPQNVKERIRKLLSEQEM